MNNYVSLFSYYDNYLYTARVCGQRESRNKCQLEYQCCKIHLSLIYSNANLRIPAFVGCRLFLDQGEEWTITLI